MAPNLALFYATSTNNAADSIPRKYHSLTDDHACTNPINVPSTSITKSLGITQHMGRIYLFGGTNGTKIGEDEAWEYDLEHDQWNELPSLPIKRYMPKVVPLNDEELWIAGKNTLYYQLPLSFSNKQVLGI